MLSRKKTPLSFIWGNPHELPLAAYPPRLPHSEEWDN